MRGYDKDEVYQRDADLDQYEVDGEELEEEGYEYEDEEGEEQEDFEQEDPKPTKEELEFLEWKQRLKEEARKKLKNENSAVLGRSQEKKKKLPNDNFGSFFGPSQPVVAPRVFEETRAILETHHNAAKAPKSHSSNKKGPASTTTGAKLNGHGRPCKVVNEVKAKVEKLKDMRDYSFLYSDDVELPDTSKELAAQNVSAPSSDARATHLPLKSRLPMSKPHRPVSSGHEERNLVSTNSHVQTKYGNQKVASVSRSGSSVAGPRKLAGSNAGNGPGRPGGPKGLVPRVPVPSGEKKALVTGINNNSVRNNPSLKPISSAQKRHSEPSKELHRPDKPKGMSAQSVSSSRPQVPISASRPQAHTSALRPKANISSSRPQARMLSKPQGQLSSSRPQAHMSSSRPQAHISSSKPQAHMSSSKPQKEAPKQIPLSAMQEERPKKKRVRRYSDEEDDGLDGASVSSMIRSMFRYNPNKYARDDDDVSDMEANFDDILKEERRSSRIAREEDERELRLIEEEERREKLKAKKRKLSQH